MEALDEKYLQYIADTYNLGLLDAAALMDNCIKFTSAKLNISYDKVYNALFTEEGLKSCLLTEKTCDQQTIEECIKGCDCFYLEPYGCLPRLLPNAEKINEDPDKYIKDHLGKIEDLKKMVEIAAYLYYNFSGGGLSDNSFDALEYALAKREKIKGRIYEKIGAPPIEKLRVKLEYPVPSLTKVKPGSAELTKFLARFHEYIVTKFGSNIPKLNCFWSVKLDGVSGVATYENGILTKLNTRGDGIIGGNVIYLKEFIKTGLPAVIPNKNKVVVRGEFILKNKVWNEKYKGSYSNARAFVSGKINAGFISSALQDIDFVSYKLMVWGEDKKLPPWSQTMKILTAQGFTVAENGIFTSPTIFDLMEFYKNKRTSCEYKIDGVVISQDKSYSADISYDEGGILENPHDSFAFKMALEEQIRNTKVINVEWNISRYGRYVPVAIYEAVYVDGVRMTRATAHNARHIQDWNMGKGTKIKIFRSGDVIPQIKDVEIDGKIVPIFPLSESNGGYEWYWEKSDIVLAEISTNKDVMIKRISHFFETIGVPRIREKTAENFYNGGLKTPESIVSSTVQEMIKIKGIGKKSADFFQEKIKEAMSTVPPDRFIIASTTFESGLGRKLLKLLFQKMPTILELSETEISNAFKKQKIPGIGQSRIERITKGIPEFKKYLDSFAKKYISDSIKNYNLRIKKLDEEGRNPKIENKKFVITGFMGVIDYELEDYIYDHHGDFVSTVTSDVEAVISGNVMEYSKKMKAAAELGVHVFTLQEFAEIYDIPLKRFEGKDYESENHED